MEKGTVKGVTPNFGAPPVHKDVKDCTPVMNVGPTSAEMGTAPSNPVIKTSPVKP